LGGPGSGGHNRKSVDTHALQGSYRADRHWWGRRHFPAAEVEPVPELDYLSQVLECGDMPESFWTHELVTRSISVTELAREAGLSRVTVSRLVNGRRQGWPETRRKLVEALRHWDPIFAYDDEVDGDDAA
jgi:DNA-binding phage protein